MRKVILQEWITIDGFASGPRGETDFVTSPVLNKTSDLDILHFMDTVDTILLGAVTYRLFVDFWPTATVETEIIADKLNATPKIVFSQTLQAAPWGKWSEARVVKKDAASEIIKLKSQPGKNMVLWGSISLARSLMKGGLIDEYELRICPVALGNGVQLFPPDMGTCHLQHLETKTYDSGLVLLRYQPAPPSKRDRKGVSGT